MDTVRRRPLTAELLTELEDELEADHDTVSDEDKDESETDLNTRGSLNRIYYGLPGTGKTYTVSRLFQEDYEQRAEDAQLVGSGRSRHIRPRRQGVCHSASRPSVRAGSIGDKGPKQERPRNLAYHDPEQDGLRNRRRHYPNILSRRSGRIRAFRRLGSGLRSARRPSQQSRQNPVPAPSSAGIHS